MHFVLLTLLIGFWPAREHDLRLRPSPSSSGLTTIAPWDWRHAQRRQRD